MKKITVLLILILSLSAFCLSSCGNTTGNETPAPESTEETASDAPVEDKETVPPEGYWQIAQDEAWGLMQSGQAEYIVDVRTEEEYAEEHIPGAICVPNEEITDTPPEALPDKDALILVYCRSGRRSKEASSKLAAMGYTNIREFGGIITWEYDKTK